MSNRILKESITSSREINALSAFEECVFYRLIVSADDYGIFTADPVMLVHLLYPMKTDVQVKAMEKALEHLESLNLIRQYHVKGKGDFLKIVSWEKHQRIRCSRHRYPMPEDSDETGTAGTGDDSAEEPAGNPGETDRPNTAEQAQEEPREVPVIELPLNDGTAYGVTRGEIREFAELYPAADVEQELRNMRGWCMANPRKRKTRSGVRKFITGWLARVQDKGGSPGTAGRAAPENPFIRMALEDAEKEAPGGRLFETLLGKGTVQ